MEEAHFVTASFEEITAYRSRKGFVAFGLETLGWTMSIIAIKARQSVDPACLPR